MFLGFTLLSRYKNNCNRLCIKTGIPVEKFYERMNLTERIEAFGRLGDWIRNLDAETMEELTQAARNENPWFVETEVVRALHGIGHFLNREELTNWTNRYHFSNPSKRVGVAMAGNIPLVGFHDLLCVVLSGHTLVAKLSSQDTVLLRRLVRELVRMEPKMDSCIFFSEHLKNVDAVIATGSDNTSRYFEYYFRKIPHIIRKNRSSCAILTGDEPVEELAKLGEDVFSYFGLGCRNVSKLFVPEKYSFTPLLDSWSSYAFVSNHHKYHNNYEYHKSILLVNQQPHLDTGFLLLREEKALVSPIAVLFYETYSSQKDLRSKLGEIQEKIQCRVSAAGWWNGSLAFGQAQSPQVDDYPDQVDTLQFLMSIT